MAKPCNIALAKNGNVDFRFNENVISISGNADAIKIVTDKNNYTANKAIASAGAWMKELLPELNLPLQIERTVLYWFNLNKSNKKFLPENFPIYIWEYKKNKMVYGFPDLGDGIKIAFHHSGNFTTPDNLNRNVTQQEINAIEKVMKQCFNVDATFNYSAVCMYTNTPDENFIIDYHPQNKNIIIASPCSGHGFKFSSAIGKLLCDMAMDKNLDIDIKLFKIKK
ncbi:MAG: FAD-dependent oxidoreductase [Chitinophagaceae bacterium]